MTKSRETGENEITEEAKRRAKRENREVGAILEEMLEAAKARGDSKGMRKIVRAQKYLGLRNIKKRRRRP
jgi:hypothetical protein